MAKKAKRITDDATEPRAPITTRNVVLLVCFAILAIVSVVTVAIPEIRDDGSEEEADAAGSTDDTAAHAAPADGTAAAAPTP
jgi:hypothetical protein